MAPFVGPVVDHAEAAQVRELVAATIEGRPAMFAERVRRGAGVDGHGDLQAEDIFVVGSGPQILDCLEFDDQLRRGDAVADVAFLAMDLERLGRPDLAATFLQHDRAASGDTWPAALEHLHVAQRAHVRCKVACLRHQRGDPGAAAVARDLHHLALGHLLLARPLVVVVGGAPGTGTSTLARGLATELGATRLSTDELRSEVLGEPAGSADPGVERGRYDPASVSRDYDELLARADGELSSGMQVVLDASWSTDDRRELVRALGRRRRAALVELCTTAPTEVAARRVERRRRAGVDASEATPEVARRLAERRDPWPTAEVIDTTSSPERSLAAARRVLERHLSPGG